MQCLLTELLGYLQRQLVLDADLCFLSPQLYIMPVTAASELSLCIGSGTVGTHCSSSSPQEIPTLYL